MQTVTDWGDWNLLGCYGLQISWMWDWWPLTLLVFLWHCYTMKQDVFPVQDNCIQFSFFFFKKKRTFLWNSCGLRYRSTASVISSKCFYCINNINVNSQSVQWGLFFLCILPNQMWSSLRKMFDELPVSSCSLYELVFSHFFLHVFILSLFNFKCIIIY